MSEELKEGKEEKSATVVEEAAALRVWSDDKAAVEKRIQYGADLSWLQCTLMAEEAGLMLCECCRAGVSFARGCNSRSVCNGTVCRRCSDAGLLCHNHSAGELQNDF